MSVGLLFWLLLIIAVIFGGLPYIRTGPAPAWVGGAGSLLFIVLLVLLGIQVFGWPIHK